MESTVRQLRPRVGPTAPATAKMLLLSRAALTVSTMAFAVFWLAPGMDQSSAALPHVFYGVAHIAGAQLCWSASASTSREQWAWRLIAVALLSSAAVSMGYVRDDAGSGALAWNDLLQLARYPLVWLAVILILSERLVRPAPLLWIDAMLVGLGAGSVATAVLIPPIDAAWPVGGSRFIVDLLYPAADLGLLVILMAIGGVVGVRAEPRLVWLATAMTCNLVADANVLWLDLNGEYVSSGPVDVVWVLAVVAFGAAACRGQGARQIDPADRSDWCLLALPVGANLAAVAVLVIGVVEPVPDIAAALAAACVVVASARMAFTVHASRALPVARAEARTDVLTGLANRRRLEERYSALLTPGRGPIGMLLLDLDGFKAVNDVAGHQVGDEVLVRTAARIASRIRAEHLAVRLGGDEFAVLMPDTGHADATRIARSIRSAIAVPMQIDGITHIVCASVGIAVSTASTTGLSELMLAADTAMYHAKRSGSGIATAPFRRARGPRGSLEATR